MAQALNWATASKLSRWLRHFKNKQQKHSSARLVRLKLTWGTRSQRQEWQVWPKLYCNWSIGNWLPLFILTRSIPILISRNHRFICSMGYQNGNRLLITRGARSSTHSERGEWTPASSWRSTRFQDLRATREELVPACSHFQQRMRIGCASTSIISSLI